jgi:hypothetical protein
MLQRVAQVYPLGDGASVNVYRKRPSPKSRLSATLTFADGHTLDSPYTYGTLEDALAWAKHEIARVKA